MFLCAVLPCHVSIDLPVIRFAQTHARGQPGPAEGGASSASSSRICCTYWKMGSTCSCGAARRWWGGCDFLLRGSPSFRGPCCATRLCGIDNSSSFAGWVVLTAARAGRWGAHLLLHAAGTAASLPQGARGMGSRDFVHPSLSVTRVRARPSVRLPACLSVCPQILGCSEAQSKPREPGGPPCQGSRRGAAPGRSGGGPWRASSHSPDPLARRLRPIHEVGMRVSEGLTRVLIRRGGTPMFTGGFPKNVDCRSGHNSRERTEGVRGSPSCFRSSLGDLPVTNSPKAGRLNSRPVMHTPFLTPWPLLPLSAGLLQVRALQLLR